ncbi:hypothetical protein [Nocardioides conyzicola]|uniref:Uncharacterized protein n=1 Tax=Nocardioides conyzicola TaxID=1651781 RepID=A0ABP8XU47_9ACTN
MDPENVRTIVTGAVTAAVGLVPAVLLYKQNQRSNDREAAERKDLRDAEEARAAHEAARVDEASLALQLEAERTRCLRLWVICDKISGALFALSDHINMPTPIVPGADRAELSTAYADVMFSADEGVRSSAATLRRVLDEIIAECVDSDTSPGSGRVVQFDSLLDEFRRVAEAQTTASGHSE